MKKSGLVTKAAIAMTMAATTVLGTAAVTTSVQAATKTKLVLGMWASSPAETALVKRQVAAFEKANPSYSVSVQVVNGNYQQALQARLAAHNAPDVFYVDSSYAPNLEASGALMPLNALAKKNHVNLASYSAALRNAFQWKGVQYGIPKDMNTLALEYNKDLLKKAGISTPPKTWIQFEADARKLKSAGIAPLSVSIDVARYYPMVLDMGGSYYNAKTNTATFTNSKNVAGLSFFINNFKSGYFVQPSDQGASWPGEAFAEGKVAFNIEGAWIVPAVQQTAPHLNWGISDLPSLNGKDANYAYTVSYSMAKTTKNPAAAAKLLFFMTGQKALKMTADSGLALPSIPSEQKEFLKKYPNYTAFVDGVKNAVPFQFGTLGNNFITAINNATTAAILKNVAPADALKQAQAALEQQSNY